MTLTFIQTPTFASQSKRLGLTDEDIESLEQLILKFPERGDIMRGTGGIRKCALLRVRGIPVKLVPPAYATW